MCISVSECVYVCGVYICLCKYFSIWKEIDFKIIFLHKLYCIMLILAFLRFDFIASLLNTKKKKWNLQVEIFPAKRVCSGFMSPFFIYLFFIVRRSSTQYIIKYRHHAVVVFVSTSYIFTYPHVKYTYR